ncbi:hypothetical protein B0H63DRAFT_246326 [Podospora didyma]|uniref:Ilp is an apoptosis inhibitor n=1 Tax=Podospora didyma TaxID=330526 RepID=A0AAE0KLF3_9PEZI|nr:hypothetical protein B0H63DRAFT_246326 [Podospora didyma]
MSYPRATGQAFKQEQEPDQSYSGAHPDLIKWYPDFQSCVHYFLEQAQFTGPVQTLAAYINIQLPFQKAGPAAALPSQPGVSGSGVGGSRSSSKISSSMSASQAYSTPTTTNTATLLPYIRRLVATGYDYPEVLHSFFGNKWEKGIKPLHEQERRNYLFAAKSDNWLKVKKAYDMGDDQTVPYLSPLQNVTEEEIVSAESGWSEWLAMQDWMLGPRAPEAGNVMHYHHNGNSNAARMRSGTGHGNSGRVNFKREQD